MNSTPKLSYNAPQYFYLVINNLPELQFLVQQATVPSVTIDEVPMSNGVNPNKTFIPGEGMDYSELNLSYMIDDEWENYRSVLQWLKYNSFPDEAKKPGGWNVDDTSSARNNYKYAYSNITLVATDAGNTPICEWNFVNAFPTSQDGPIFDTTQPDIEYLTSNITFRYDYMVFNRLNGSDLDPV